MLSDSGHRRVSLPLPYHAGTVLTRPILVNYPEPGKRPLSSTVPTIMEHPDGSFYLAVGGSGGSKIFGAVLQVILGIDQWGLDVSQSIEFGRVHDQLYPTEVEVDDILPDDDIQALRARGHNVTSKVSSVVSSLKALIAVHSRRCNSNSGRCTGRCKGEGCNIWYDRHMSLSPPCN